MLTLARIARSSQTGRTAARARAAVAACIATGVAARDTAFAGHGGGVAHARAAVGVARASAVVCDATGAVTTRLACGARASSGAADAGVIAAAGVAVGALAVAATLVTGSIAAVLEVTGAAHRGRAGAVATRIPDTADRRRIHITTLSARSGAFGTLTGTLTCS